MTYLLRLLKTHEPVADYSSLPSTGKGLVNINGSDWPPNIASKKTNKKLPSAVSVGTGKYLHFGLESALIGESPGVVHRDADLLQFVDVYVENPSLLPENYRKRVS